MKKMCWLMFILCLSLMTTGCFSKNEKNVVKSFKKQVSGIKGYHIKGEMEIFNNEEVYKYKVEAAYSAKDLYRVSLYNVDNKHEQIILKNATGVYVLTPALNKSFKFQSDWPNNNSQIYLLGSILNDLESDKNKEFKKIEDGYKLISKVNYPNNENLVRQEVIFDKKMKIKEVIVLDKEDKPGIKMKFTKVDLKARFKEDYFDLKQNMETARITEEIESASKLDDVLYPMFLPVNTKLGDKDKVSKMDGERSIMTFVGDKPFILVEETVRSSNVLDIIHVIGDPVILGDGVAALTNNSINWHTKAKEYYIASSNLSRSELIKVANSISVNVAPVGK